MLGPKEIQLLIDIRRVHKMASSDQLNEEAMAYCLDNPSELQVSPDAVVRSLKELQVALRQVSELSHEEDEALTSFLEVLKILAPLISKIQIDTSILPTSLGLVESIRLNPEGILYLTRPWGKIEPLKLTGSNGKELMKPLLEDLIIKLRSFNKGTYKIKSTAKGLVPEKPVMGVKETYDPEIPTKIFEPEPKTEEKLTTPKKPPMVETPSILSVQKEETVAEVKERISKIHPEHVPQEAQQQIPKEAIDESPPRIEPPERDSDVLLLRYRRTARKRKHRISSDMADIKRRRDNIIERMRTASDRGFRVLAERNTGFLGFLKKLFSRDEPAES
jgi:hypothetical protein